MIKVLRIQPIPALISYRKIYNGKDNIENLGPEL